MRWKFWQRPNRMVDVVAVCAVPQIANGENNNRMWALAHRLNIYGVKAEKLIAKALRLGLIQEAPRVHPLLENYEPTKEGWKLLGKDK